MLVRLVFTAVVTGVALAGCSDEDTATGVDSHAGSYALVTDESWQMREAVDPPSDDSLTANERPPLDWYGEYVRSEYTEMIRLSSHEANLSDTQSALQELGFSFRAVSVPGHGEGFAGTASDDDSSPVVLLVQSDDHTLMALSYDVGPEALVEFMGAVEAAGEAEWVAAGGVIR